MTPEQTKALAAAGESESLEFKGSTGTRREAAQTVCAMLNQRGGHVWRVGPVVGRSRRPTTAGSPATPSCCSQVQNAFCATLECIYWLQPSTLARPDQSFASTQCEARYCH